ncbi:MAG TPA: peptide MFS transporter [Anaeromyxobacter sp.]|nr:peptide MFS transporter [Anaeromyxobacter sp.]
MSDTSATPAVGLPPAAADTRFFGHPRGLRLLFEAEMWERFSFYGMRALIVPFLVNVQGWQMPAAANVYGTYNMAVYLTPLVGGYLADRWIGTRRSLLIGGAIISAGHFVLALPSMRAFYVGLSLVVIGTGFFKPNASTMVGQLYAKGDARRDAGFTLFYMGINLGAFLGPIACGWLAETAWLGWHYGFAAAGVGMALGLVAYVRRGDAFLGDIGKAPAARARAAAAARAVEPHEARRTAAHAAAGALAGGALAALLAGPSAVPLLAGGAVGAMFGVTVLGSRGEERRRVLALFIVVFFVIFFWAAYEQTGSSMNMFAFENTDMVFFGWKMPATWFQSFNPVVILIFAPLFASGWQWLARRRREPSTASKMVLGLFLLGVGFLFMIAGGARADGGVLVSPIWLALAYAFHTWGELCLSPVGLSYVSKLAPARFASLLMGAWFLANSAGQKIAGALAGFTPLPGAQRPAGGAGLAGYLQEVSATNAGFYSIFVVSSFAAAGLMLLFVPLLKRLASGADSPGGAQG